MFIKATHEIIHQVCEFTNTTFDDKYMEMTYLNNQAYPSPYGMPVYEDVDTTKLGSFFVNHKTTMAQCYEPDFGGKRVQSYIKLHDMAHWVNKFIRVFNHSTNHYNICPSYMDQQDVLLKNIHIHVSKS